MASVHVCVCVCVYVCACVCLCVYACVCVLCVYVCDYAYVCVCMCVHPWNYILKTVPVKWSWNDQLCKEVIYSYYVPIAYTINIMKGCGLSNKVCHDWLPKDVKSMLYHTQTQTLTWTHACTHTHTRTHAHIHTCTCARTRTHTHTHTHTCTHRQPCINFEGKVISRNQACVDLWPTSVRLYIQNLQFSSYSYNAVSYISVTVE